MGSKAVLCGVLLLILSHLPAAAAAAPELPGGRLLYREQLVREVHFYWGVGQAPAVFFAQVHQESRFQADARSRYALGLAQFTPATAQDAQARFPALQLLCPSPAGCPLNPQWALRALVLWDRHLYERRSFARGEERWGFMLADYNGGAQWIERERAYCQVSGQCSPQRYFGEVQQACGKSSPARSPEACRENTQYPERILRTWRPVYSRWLLGE